MVERWSVSTEHGSNLSADELVGVLASHHERVTGGWQALSPEQWEQPSRNRLWSAHDTARHVADAMQAGTAEVLGDPPPFVVGAFDPRTTPETWLAASAGDPPERTIERFSDAAEALRVRVGERLAAGDESIGATVYGPAHWTVMVVHLLWDSWLHERDVLLPIGLPAGSTRDEQRLVALYGLLMSLLPSRMGEQDLGIVIHFTDGATVSADHRSGQLSGAEVADRECLLVGDLCSVVDSLSGRGAPLGELLPEAPEPLRAFADFMAD